MLSNEKWSKRGLVGDPLKATIGDLVSWLETKPRDERYDYSETFNCALCHFLSDNGVALPAVDSRAWGTDTERATLPEDFKWIAGGDYLFQIDAKPAWTFGEMLDRARSLAE